VGVFDSPLAQANQLRLPYKKSTQDGINMTERALQEIRETIVERGNRHSGEDDNEVFHNKL
jgi:hypothetical protein